MSTLYDQMLASYDRHSEQARHNAACEVCQQVALAGLSQGGFFDKAAFYGGTCLRIFHGLQRYSEDMDFTLLRPDSSFDFSRYFQPIIDEFSAVGRQVEIRKKEKNTLSRVESAFLKDNTDIYDLRFQAVKSIKIKIEVDTRPPLDFDTDYQLMLQPRSVMVRCLKLPCLFAGKLHALLFRTWKKRIKGRDWYDFEWYIRHDVPVSLRHLQARIREFNDIELTDDDIRLLIRKLFTTTDIHLVRQDVLPFIRNANQLDIWSRDYFLALADKLRFTD